MTPEPFAPGAHWRARTAAGARRCFAGLLIAAAVVSVSCGKQGPPLAPLVRQPSRISDLTVRRLDTTVYVRFTIPDSNQDGSKPADLERVVVYAFTATRPADGRDLKSATLVATVPVRRPLSPEEAQKQRDAGATPGAPAPPPPDRGPGLEQGAVAVVTETLTEASYVPIVVEPARGGGRTPAPARRAPAARGGGGRARGARAAAVEEEGGEDQRPVSNEPALSLTGPIELPLAGPVDQRPLNRYYVAYGVSRKGRKGIASQRVGIPLAAPPGAPGPLKIGLAEKAVALSWTPPAGIPQPVQGPATGSVLRSSARGLVSRVNIAYDVYEVAAPLQSPVQTGALAMPTPLNDKPVDRPEFDDGTFEFGKQRCYVVRAVQTIGTGAVEGPASPVACVTPLDTFPPPAPKSLAAVASGNAISLIWEAVTSPDLGGYLVLRGEAPGDNLDVITPEPIHETTYRDASVKPGVRYVYAVVAVDTSKPPNRSAPSNKVEASVR